MSISSELSRITTDRNTIRTKLVGFGLATSTDTLDDLADEINAIADRGSPSASVQEGDSYTIQPGYYHGGTVQGVAGGGNYNLQAKTNITPTKSKQTIAPDQGYYGLSSVEINAIPDNYQDVSSVTVTASDVLANKTFVPAGGTLTAGTMPNNGAVSKILDATTGNQSYTVPAGYHNGSGKVQISLETKNTTPSNNTQEITPTSGKVLSKVTVAAIPSNYGNANNADAAAADLLSGKTAITLINKVATEIEGTMPNNGATNATLDTTTTSKTIPRGYTSGGTVNIVLETKTVTPATGTQNVTPTTGKVLSKVVVNAIPTNFVNSNTVDAIASNVLSGKKAVVSTGSSAWGVVSGTMSNNGAISEEIDGLTVMSVSIPTGYTSGGTVSLTSDIETALAAI